MIDVASVEAAELVAGGRSGQVTVRAAGTGGIQVVVLEGALHARRCREVSDAMAAALSRAPTAVVVDLSAVRRLDRDGAMVIVFMRRRARRLGAVLPVAGANPSVVAALHDFHLAGLLEFYPTVARAIDHLRRRRRSGPAAAASPGAPFGPLTGAEREEGS